MASEKRDMGLSGPEEFAADGGEIEVRPDVVFLEALLKSVHAGQVRVPKFQRPFVWRPEQLLDLFDSIERGYPIGSLLLWETPQRLESLDKIGELPIPPAQPGRNITYVLDGHQRLSTLYSCLYQPEDVARSAEEDQWIWRVYRVLGEENSRTNRYVHWKKSSTSPPAHYLPMRSVLKTLDFLAYARKLTRSQENSARYDDLVEEAEQVAQRIKSYKISVVTLVGGTLAQAVEVFSRVNSMGQSMSPDQMVSALTYRQGEESLADRIGEILRSIAEEGFGEIDPITAFRAVLAVAGEEEVTAVRWDVLARRVEGGVFSAVADADRALSHAVRFLREKIGVPLARLIPYNNQLMLLTVFFHHCPEPTEEQIEVLTRWFWITSWAGFFASVTSTTLRQAIQDMRAFATGEKFLPDFEGTQGIFDFADQRPRPYPEKFDLRSARVRAYLLWELREFPTRYTLDGQEYRAVSVVERLDRAAFRRVSNRPGLVNGSDPANRVILEPIPGCSVQNHLSNAAHSPIREKFLNSICITPDDIHLLERGQDEEFIANRADALKKREQRFIESMTTAPMAPAVSEEIVVDAG